MIDLSARRPTAFMSSVWPPMPTTSVAKISGTMMHLIRCRNRVETTLTRTAASGNSPAEKNAHDHRQDDPSAQEDAAEHGYHCKLTGPFFVAAGMTRHRHPDPWKPGVLAVDPSPAPEGHPLPIRWGEGWGEGAYVNSSVHCNSSTRVRRCEAPAHS